MGQKAAPETWVGLEWRLGQKQGVHSRVLIFLWRTLYTHTQKNEGKVETVKRIALGSRKGSRLAQRQGLWGGGHSR